MIYSGCPGADKLRNPTIIDKICPVCGNEIEMFSTDTELACDKCGFVAYNDTLSCIQWCKYAEKCIGTELYNKLVKHQKEKEAQAEAGNT